MYGPDGPSFLELARQALSSTERGYDLLAPKFDATPFRTPDALLARVEEVLRKGPAPTRALDLCCGTGAGAAMLCRVCPEVVGIDQSEGMLQVARRTVPEARFLRGDALAPPGDGPFDVVTCFGAFGHIQVHEQPAFLDAVRLLLAPGGRFVFVTGFQIGPDRREWWVLRTFNGVMRVRNRLIRPPFHMYYLNFRVPDILPRFDAAGLRLLLHPTEWAGRSFLIGEATAA